MTLNTAGNYTIRVNNPDGGQSNIFGFTVTASVTPPPAITGFSPNPVPGSNNQQTMTISGTGFQSGASVTLFTKGQTFPIPSNRTTFINANQIQILASVSTQAANWTAQVTNPDGQSSNTWTFQVR